MTTEQYINTLKNPVKEPATVAARQVLCHYLYSENISCNIISKVLGCSRRIVYRNIYRTRDLLEVNDKITLAAYKEIENHHMTIRPCIIEGTILSQYIGYKMIIDNLIY